MSIKYRNLNVDIAKGIGIALVVLGHNLWIYQHSPEAFLHALFSFHMPLFFFLSGIFLAPERAFLVLLKQRINSLLKPYAVVLGLLGICYMLRNAEFNPDYFLGMLYGTGQSILWTPLWFLPNLFLVQLAGIGILRMLPASSNERLIFLIALGLLLIGIPLIRMGHDFMPGTLEIMPGNNRQLVGLPWGLDIVPLNTAFLLAGFCTAPWLEKIRIHAVGLTAACGALFILLNIASDATLNLHGRTYDDAVLTSIKAVLGIYAVMGLSCLLGNYRTISHAIARLGNASLFILIFHSYIQGKLSELLQPYFPAHPAMAAWAGFSGGLLIPWALYEISSRSRLLSGLLLPHSPISQRA